MTDDLAARAVRTAEQRVRDLEDALRLVEWGTESLCAACWGRSDTPDTPPNETPYGVQPRHAPGCPVAAALLSDERNAE